jgi:hypothetical protein
LWLIVPYIVAAIRSGSSCLMTLSPSWLLANHSGQYYDQAHWLGDLHGDLLGDAFRAGPLLQQVLHWVNYLVWGSVWESVVGLGGGGVPLHGVGFCQYLIYTTHWRGATSFGKFCALVLYIEREWITVMYCAVLCCAVLCCTVLYCTVLYFGAPQAF